MWLLINLGLVYALMLLLRANGLMKLSQQTTNIGLAMACCLLITACNVLLAMRCSGYWRIVFAASALLTLASFVLAGVLGFMPIMFNPPVLFSIVRLLTG